ncbi:MAG: IS3 family transposase [Chitinophagaceae bacterium]|nr:IS3 family transposase [Chitinophagaceae bacterium]
MESNNGIDCCDACEELTFLGGSDQQVGEPCSGNCYDNEQPESFFSRLKSALLENGVFKDVFNYDVFNYIEGYYNRVRLHSSLGDKTPMEYEAEIKVKNKEGKENLVSIYT